MAVFHIALVVPVILVSFVIAAPSYDGRIVGGLLAPEHSFPFLAGLSITREPKENGTFWCGGSLIAPNIVLTAAHCVSGQTLDVKVKLGTHKRNTVSPHGDLIDVHPSGITIHELYDPDMTDNDIAVIHLPLNVTLTDDIQLIQLASSYMDQAYLEDQPVTAAGWGRSGDNTTGIPLQLRYVDIMILNQAKCAKHYDPGVVTPRNICTDGSSFKGTCLGDSGGPLIYHAADDTRYLVGLTSFGSTHGCEKGYPTAFTRVTEFLDWIAVQTGVGSV